MYNQQQACCNPAMETEFEAALGRWKDDWHGVLERLTFFRDSLASLQVDESYVDSPGADQRALDRAILAFGPVLDLYGLCFNTMLEFLAGVLCFSCEPWWQQVVSVNGSDIGYLVAPESYDAVQHSCQVWQGYVRQLRIAVQDSRLAKRLAIPFEHP